VELRLTTNLQLQPLPQLVTREHPGLGPWKPMYTRPSAVLVEPRSTAPLSPSLPVRAFSAANRACDEASDVLSHEPGWIRPDRLQRVAPSPPAKPHPRHLGPLDPHPPPPRQRTTTSMNQDAFHRREPPRGDPPVSLLACSWLSPLRAGSSAASPRSFPSVKGEPAG
jgi:hypothetical protein